MLQPSLTRVLTLNPQIREKSFWKVGLRSGIDQTVSMNLAGRRDLSILALDELAGSFGGADDGLD
jgi:hypothetical protein